MPHAVEIVLKVLEATFGKRRAKMVFCLVLIAFGIKRSVIYEKLGVSYKALRRYNAALDEGNIEELFESKGRKQQSALVEHAVEIEKDFDNNPPKTLRDAQERIKKITGLTRSLTRIRVFLKKGALNRAR